MNKGCLIFAHDGVIDYGSQAVLSASLVQKNLQVPVSLVTDQQTADNISTRYKSLPFEKIIIVESPDAENYRWLTDGGDTDYKPVNFINKNRSSVYNLTPYERTLVIDSDFLVLSDQLNKFWNSPYDFLITPGMNNLQETQTQPDQYKISRYSIDMLWATNIMFSKNPTVELFFDLVNHVKNNYLYYSYIYNFPAEQFRNDHIFSVACHIMSAEGLDPWHGKLPVPIWFKDTDQICQIKETGQINFLCRNFAVDNGYVVIKTYKQDIHLMNKFDLLRNLPNLMELASG